MGAVAQIIDLDSAARWPSAARSDEGKLLYAQFLLKIIVLPRICFHTGFVGEGLGPPARPGIAFPDGASPAPTKAVSVCVFQEADFLPEKYCLTL